MQNKKPLSKAVSMYAIPCLNEIGEHFFVTFDTKSEKEALTLAECIQGRKGKRALVIITEHGDIFNL